MRTRVWILLAAVAVAVVVVFLLPAIPQSEGYHSFADKRTLFGIPNCLNVFSNAPFLLIGLAGMAVAERSERAGRRLFLDARQRWRTSSFSAV